MKRSSKIKVNLQFTTVLMSGDDVPGAHIKKAEACMNR